MYYEKRGDPLPLMEETDQISERFQHTNEMRRQINKYHWAFQQNEKEQENMERIVGLLLVLCTILTVWMVFLTVWVFVR